MGARLSPSLPPPIHPLSLAPKGHLLIHSLHFRVLIGGTAALISRGASKLHPRRSASSAEGVCQARSLPTICHGHTKLFGKLCGPNSHRWRTGPSLLSIQMTQLWRSELFGPFCSDPVSIKCGDSPIFRKYVVGWCSGAFSPLLSFPAASREQYLHIFDLIICSRRRGHFRPSFPSLFLPPMSESFRT